MTGNSSAQVIEVIIPNKTDNDGIIILLRLLNQTQFMVTGKCIRWGYWINYTERNWWWRENASTRVTEVIIPKKTDYDGIMPSLKLLK